MFSLKKLCDHCLWHAVDTSDRPTTAQAHSPFCDSVLDCLELEVKHHEEQYELRLAGVEIEDLHEKDAVTVPARYDVNTGEPPLKEYNTLKPRKVNEPVL